MKSCLDSLIDLQRQYREKLVALSQKNGLTLAEWQLLLKIVDGASTQEKLAKMTQLNVSTLSRQLSKLLSKEFVVKKSQESQQGRRFFAYTSTFRGLDAIADMKKDIAQYSKQLFSHWSEEEQNLLQILLNRLSKSMERM
ncbi:MarR family transcriptional regulator [Lactobacillus sp. UCMA15818]|uniref:MarR family winged helix-turn-helix transcriptional regulator n=1 Tax=Lactobacillaceae TaxID=33958 RepID=UPI0025B09528|nr:MarR family transcriptional regulator [Lactobacillus sp. UCMA15818]MDN2452247.1 MarR family transcriptional regulator [Lactobacillus sp. UCMA15818]